MRFLQLMPLYLLGLGVQRRRLLPVSSNLALREFYAHPLAAEFAARQAVDIDEFLGPSRRGQREKSQCGHRRQCF